MSWGYFVDLRLTLPSDDWTALARRAPRDCPVPASWPARSAFAKAFRSEYWQGLDVPFQKIAFAKAPLWKLLRGDALRSVRPTEDERVDVRLLVLLDKSLLDGAAVIAALFFGAAQQARATGRLAVVNDGTGPGEDGWCFTLARGKVKAAKIEDAGEFGAELAALLYPGVVPVPARPAEQLRGVANGRWGINPMTGAKIWIPGRGAP